VAAVCNANADDFGANSRLILLGAELQAIILQKKQPAAELLDRLLSIFLLPESHFL
jgi:hypothetical protein